MRYCADLHGNTKLLKRFIEKSNCSGKEYLCILGDAGINYYNDSREQELKAELQSMIDKIHKDTFLLFIRGNHEIRPEDLSKYKETDMFDGKVYIEEEFPNLIFLKDGEIYTIGEKKYLVLGGGYSRDCFSRILNDIGYWSNEELSLEEIYSIIEKSNKKIRDDIIVLSHMLPESVSPLSGRDGGSTQIFLQKILDSYRKNIVAWHAGHYHKDIAWKQDGVSFYIHNKISKEI